MPLLKCEDCGFEHSDQAEACPKCGRPNKKASQEKSKKSSNANGCFGCLGTLFVLVVIGMIGSQCQKSEQLSKITDCNSGAATACEALAEDSTFDAYDSITNPDFRKRFQEKKQKAAQVSANASRLAACETVLKATLKDPDSLKVLDRDYENVTITYTATNGFGGRVKNMIDCKSGKNYD